jgi:DNA polymerase-3 subunit gamma/tau
VGPAPAAGPVDLGLIQDVWPAVLDAVREQSGLLGACLADALPCELDGPELVIGFPESGAFHRRQAEDPGNRGILAEAIRAIAGIEPRLRFEVRDLPDAPAAQPPPTEEEWLARFKAEFDAEEILPEPTEDSPEEA